jgi:error-prone DNA polymerase
MIERVETGGVVSWFCNLCSHDWQPVVPRVRFRALEDFIKRSGVNKEELSVLADIGALNAFGYHRREALWQIEKAIRPEGELFEGAWDTGHGTGARGKGQGARGKGQGTEGGDQEPEGARSLEPMAERPCPLSPMSEPERMVADYAGTKLTIGPHPMSLRRRELSMRGVLRAIDLPRERNGRRIRVAGTVITRQRPGTAKGFVFLTLEDETGISNIIVRPDVFAAQRLAILEEPFVMVEGLLQNQEGVTSVRAERVEGMPGVPIEVESHDFY